MIVLASIIVTLSIAFIILVVYFAFVQLKRVYEDEHRLNFNEDESELYKRLISDNQSIDNYLNNLENDNTSININDRS